MRKPTNIRSILIIGALTLLSGTNAYAVCRPEEPTGPLVPAATKSLPRKDGTIVHFVPTGIAASSIYYKVLHADTQCNPTLLTAQYWDGKKILMTERNDNETLGCAELTLNKKTGIIRCDVNSGASLTKELSYKISGDHLELLKVVESESIDDTHTKRTTVYRNKKPHA